MKLEFRNRRRVNKNMRLKTSRQILSKNNKILFKYEGVVFLTLKQSTGSYYHLLKHYHSNILMSKNVFKRMCQLSIIFELIIFPSVPGYGYLNIRFHFFFLLPIFIFHNNTTYEDVEPQVRPQG